MPALRPSRGCCGRHGRTRWPRSPREREVLALIAEGQSNTAIARSLVVTEATAGEHAGNIFAKLRLPQTDDINRRVLAVLAYLRSDA